MGELGLGSGIQSGVVEMCRVGFMMRGGKWMLLATDQVILGDMYRKALS